MNHIPISNRIIWSALELSEPPEQHTAGSDDTETHVVALLWLGSETIAYKGIT